jgi:hypothetical protein
MDLFRVLTAAWTWSAATSAADRKRKIGIFFDGPRIYLEVIGIGEKNLFEQFRYFFLAVGCYCT